jgi:hypothetical protein
VCNTSAGDLLLPQPDDDDDDDDDCHSLLGAQKAIKATHSMQSLQLVNPGTCQQGLTGHIFQP